MSKSADQTQVTTEVLFYHLEQFPLQRILPPLLEKSLERGWRVVLQCGDEQRMEALNIHLWTYREDSFLPHGTASDGPPERQPIFLTTSTDNPNQAGVRFLVDGAQVGELGGYDRAVYIFDGTDRHAVVTARMAWKQISAAGFQATYWQQTAAGGWTRKA